MTGRSRVSRIVVASIALALAGIAHHPAAAAESGGQARPPVPSDVAAGIQTRCRARFPLDRKEESACDAKQAEAYRRHLGFVAIAQKLTAGSGEDVRRTFVGLFESCRERSGGRDGPDFVDALKCCEATLRRITGKNTRYDGDRVILY